MPDLNMYTNPLLNFHPHYVTTIGMYLHLVGYQILMFWSYSHYKYVTLSVQGPTLDVRI